MVELGELNQTALVSFSGLNLKKHRCLLDELQVNNLIHKTESLVGKRMIVVYKPTQKGIEFCRSILEPYEKMFPRRKEPAVLINSHNKEEEEHMNKKPPKVEEKCPQHQKSLIVPNPH